MAVQVQDVARQVVANLGIEGGMELAAQWLSQRYQELLSRSKFRMLRQYGEIYLPAPLSAGTVAFTQDSPTVTLDATALAAAQTNKFLGYPNGFEGLWFRPQSGTVWHRIKGVVGNTITLETPMAQDNGSLFTTGTFSPNNAYYIIPRYVDLDPTARQLGTFVCDFIFRPMTLMSEDQLNRMYPNRFLIIAYPQIVAELNTNLNATGLPKRVEIYPWPVTSVTMHYTFWQSPPPLSLYDQIPPTIDPDILRKGMMIDVCTNLAGKERRKGNLEAARDWKQDAMAARAEWEMSINRAIRNDRGAEDVAFVLKRNGCWGHLPVDWEPNPDAYTNFLLRGY